MNQTKPEYYWSPAGGIGRGLRFAQIVVALFAILIMASSANATTMHPDYADQNGGQLYKPAVEPNQTLRVHRVGNVYFSITNYGKLGSEARDITDPLTNLPAPSCEFPAGSNIDYLFQGCIWIGAVVDDPDNPGELDTLVSIGDDGWWSDINELNPESPPDGQILMLSIRGESAPPYAPTFGQLSDLSGRTFDAISEQDFICVFTDTVVIGVAPDAQDNRPHKPLNIRIVQKSYSWSYEYAEDFILMDFEIENIGDSPMDSVWIGLYIDADVLHTSEDGYGDEEGAQDDICGFLRNFYPDQNDTSVYTEINTAWIADNDGQPDGPYDNPGSFIYSSGRGVSGCRVVQSPNDSLDYGFNWWISHSNSPLDWGPTQAQNARIFPGGGRGTPGGDWAKYFVMANGEFDYDQIYSALDWSDSTGNWIENPTEDPDDLADGYDTRYLYSFGQFDQIEPGTTLPLTIAYVCGDKLHQDPSNWVDNLYNHTQDPVSINEYYNNLDFQDFATNAQWAEWVYDNPGRDSCFIDGMWETDGDSGLYRNTGVDANGDSIRFWYKGDGCPDFKGPPPPYSPKLTVEPVKSGITISWDGINLDEDNSGSEDGFDSFNGKQDFEGYAVYMSYDELEWTLLCRYDKIDWVPVTWDNTISPAQWVVNKERFYPITTDSVNALGWDPYTPDWNNTAVTNWEAFDLNTGLGWEKAEFDTLTDGYFGIFNGADTVEGKIVNHYSYSLDGLASSRGIYFSVTAFDFGDPLTDLGSLESAKSINATLVYPIDKTEPINVYPNPYKITDTQYYIDMGYEDPNREGWHEQDRRIWFANLPDEQRAIIRIWTLDGDLVRVLAYNPEDAIGNPAGITYWDLVTRNGQAIVSGLYLYTIEFIPIGGAQSRESEIGKFVIIK